jgi:hypothetical protein
LTINIYLKVYLIIFINLISKVNFLYAQGIYELDTLRSISILRPNRFNVSSLRFEDYILDSDSLFLNRLRVRKFETNFRHNSNRPLGGVDGRFIQINGSQFISSLQVAYLTKKIGVILTPAFFLVHSSTPRNNVWGNSIFVRRNQFLSEGSSFFLSLKKIQVGLSDSRFSLGPTFIENLLLGNNAPGFKHIYIRNLRPINIGIGVFNFDLSVGKLQPAVNGDPYENASLRAGTRFLPSALNRYYNGVSISFMPRFLRNNYFGFIRQYQIRLDKLNFEKRILLRYLPIFQTIQKFSANGSEDSLNRDQQLSLFYTLVMPSIRSQISIEYGWNDHKWNFRDLFVSWPHSAAYIVSFKKIGNLKNYRTDFLVEYVHMQQHLERSIRNAGDWYSFHGGSVGPTQYGQILGVGGSNGLGVNKLYILYRLFGENIIYGFKYIGIKNDHTYLSTRPPVWKDHNFSFTFAIRRKQIMSRAEFVLTQSRNYGFSEFSKTSLQVNFGIILFNDK